MRIDDSLEEDGEMSIQRKSLHEVFAERNKVPTTKGTSDPPPPPLVVNPFATAPLKKKRKEKDIPKEGELAPQKEPKYQTTAKAKGKASSVESKEDYNVAEVHLQNPV